MRMHRRRWIPNKKNMLLDDNVEADQQFINWTITKSIHLNFKFMEFSLKFKKCIRLFFWNVPRKWFFILLFIKLTQDDGQEMKKCRQKHLKNFHYCFLFLYKHFCFHFAWVYYKSTWNNKLLRFIHKNA